MKKLTERELLEAILNKMVSLEEAKLLFKEMISGPVNLQDFLPLIKSSTTGKFLSDIARGTNKDFDADRVAQTVINEIMSSTGSQQGGPINDSQVQALMNAADAQDNWGYLQNVLRALLQKAQS